MSFPLLKTDSDKHFRISLVGISPTASQFQLKNNNISLSFPLIPSPCALGGQNFLCGEDKCAPARRCTHWGAELSTKESGITSFIPSSIHPPTEFTAAPEPVLLSALWIQGEQVSVPAFKEITPYLGRDKYTGHFKEVRQILRSPGMSCLLNGCSYFFF